MRRSDKDLKGQPLKGQPNMTDAEGFGLGIQVFKIDAQALKGDTNKKDKRMFIQNVENPMFARKYEKPSDPQGDKSTEESRINRLKKISAVLPEASKTEKSSADGATATFTKPNLSVNKRSGTVEKTPQPSSTSKQLFPSDTQKVKKTAPTPPLPGPKRPTKQQQKPKDQLILSFPTFDHEQLRQFESSQKQIQAKRRELKRRLKKKKQDATPEQQQQIQIQLEAIDKKSVIDEIVELNGIHGYKTSPLEEQFGIVQFVNGQFSRPEEEQYVQFRQRWQGFVNNVQQQKEQRILPEPQVVNPAKLQE